MNFGEALMQLRIGSQVTRDGWSSAGPRWLVLVRESAFEISAGRPLGDALPDKIGHPMTYRAHIDVFDAWGQLSPWTPTHADLLADDWLVQLHGSLKPTHRGEFDLS